MSFKLFLIVSLIIIFFIAIIFIISRGPDEFHSLAPVVIYSNTPVIDNKITITIVAISGHIKWDDVRIELLEIKDSGFNYIQWEPVSKWLNGGSPVFVNYTAQRLGSLIVSCKIHDILGDGYVGAGDYYELFTYGNTSTFSPDACYYTHLCYEPNGEIMGVGITFTG
ncbi:MAG: hypothetical protein QXN93_05535 [Methanomassiliicoccales archaeon]